MVLAIMVLLCVSMVPMTANAGETKIIPIGINFKFHGDGVTWKEIYRGGIFLNDTETLIMNWTNGQLGSNDCFLVVIYPMTILYNWTGFTESGTDLYPINVYYWFYSIDYSSMPQSATMKISSTGLITIQIWMKSAVDQTIIFNIENKTVDKFADLNNKLDKIETTMDELNTTIAGLGDNNNIRNITKDIAKLQEQILNLTNQTNINSINISILENYIIDLQNKINDIRAQIKTINSTMVTNVSITQRVNLTNINGSLNNLTTALANLNDTVQGLDIPPDTQSDVVKLQQENTQLTKELNDLKKKVGLINNTSSVVVNNNTLYNNTTKTKNIPTGTTDIIAGGVIGGAITGIIVGMVATVSSKRKEEPPEQEQTKLYEDITNKVEPSLKNDDTIDDILGKLKPDEKTKIKSKNADSEVDEVPIKTQSIQKASEIKIGEKKYTESQILSKLSSLPRGLPNEFFGKDLTDLSALLMTVEYRTDKNGDIVFQSGTRWYYGDPDNIATFMQRAKKI